VQKSVGCATDRNTRSGGSDIRVVVSTNHHEIPRQIVGWERFSPVAGAVFKARRLLDPAA
jgi:hypothetical protein